MTTKTRVTYRVYKAWNDKWMLDTNKEVPYDSVDDVIQAVKALYKLEDKNLVDCIININGNDAIDLLIE